ncbi:hypothetical protein L218DRAFT_131712 [Marasmius fiardii PR-910]|nr:hypothetical protein L218DRAFT_131712 [Marasmius fiardii PR-910]
MCSPCTWWPTLNRWPVWLATHFLTNSPSLSKVATTPSRFCLHSTMVILTFHQRMRSCWWTSSTGPSFLPVELLVIKLLMAKTTTMTMMPTGQSTKRPRLLHWLARPPKLQQQRSRSPRSKVQKSRNQRPKTLRPQLPLPLEPELALANRVVNPSLLLLPIFPVATSTLLRKKSRLVPLPRGPRLLW